MNQPEAMIPNWIQEYNYDQAIWKEATCIICSNSANHAHECTMHVEGISCKLFVWGLGLSPQTKFIILLGAVDSLPFDNPYTLIKKTNSSPFHLQILKRPEGVQRGHGVRWNTHPIC